MGNSVLFRSRTTDSGRSCNVLAVDVGGTKTNLALFRHENGRSVLIREKTSVTKDFPAASHCLKDFLGDDLPDRICLGVAGPVQDGKVLLTNVSWEIDAHRLSESLNGIPVFLINDLEATAYGLMALEEKDLEVLNPGVAGSKGNIGIIAPGTGLGEAGLYWDGAYHHPFATEGGHCDFAPRTTTHMQLYNHLHQQLGGHVSWERVVSGMGIVNIYEFLRDKKEMVEPAWLAEKMQAGDRAATISAHAADCAICSETIALFFTFLAAESANMALKFKATGGVYIGGGIIRKNLQYLQRNVFIREFCSSGRLSSLLKDIPITMILNEKTALLGAACYAVLQE